DPVQDNIANNPGLGERPSRLSARAHTILFSLSRKTLARSRTATFSGSPPVSILGPFTAVYSSSIVSIVVERRLRKSWMPGRKSAAWWSLVPPQSLAVCCRPMPPINKRAGWEEAQQEQMLHRIDFLEDQVLPCSGIGNARHSA